MYMWLLVSKKVVSWFGGLPENVGNVLRVSPFFMCLEFGPHGVLALCYAACSELVDRD